MTGTLGSWSNGPNWVWNLAISHRRLQRSKRSLTPETLRVGGAELHTAFYDSVRFRALLSPATELTTVALVLSRVIMTEGSRQRSSERAEL